MTHSSEVRYAGFWIRVVADFIDSILLDVAALLMCLSILGAVFWGKMLFSKMGHGAPPAFVDSIPPFFLQVILYISRGVFSFIYYVYMAFYHETSLGKRIFKIYIVSTDTQTRITLKQSVLRFFGYFFSYLPFGAGFLMAAFHPRKQALHDQIAGTVCIYRHEGIVPVPSEGSVLT